MEVVKQERQIQLSDDGNKNKEDESMETESLKESDLGSIHFDQMSEPSQGVEFILAPSDDK